MRYVSLYQIMDRLLHNPLLTEVSFERVVDYTIDFLEIVNAPVSFVDRYFEGRLEDYMLELPCDIVQIKQVLIDDVAVRLTTDTFISHCGKGSFNVGDVTFTIQNGYLQSSTKCGNVKIAYKGILTDDNGYPMIPDNRVFFNALEKYVESKHLRILWQNNMIKDSIYLDSQKEYTWAVGQCDTALRQLELPAVDSLFNSWKTLLTYDNQFAERFIRLGKNRR
jgi:hypothetical protein